MKVIKLFKKIWTIWFCENNIKFNILKKQILKYVTKINKLATTSTIWHDFVIILYKILPFKLW